MEWLSDPQAWAALATLTALEIVLGIDNIIFISILVGRLPARQREKARILGLALAMLTRLALLMSLVWVMGLNASLFTLFGNDISGRDLILLGGGLFLLVKSTSEIHESLEGAAETRQHQAVASFAGVLAQIAIIDIVFSLDSVITAVGLAQQIAVMAIAIVISVLVMMFAARAISDFVDTHPTIKMLALSFLILVGTALIAEGLDFHVPRGYIYFAMAFSVAVEMLNLRMRRRAAPVKLHKPVVRKHRA
ncbi:MAG TPA: TerC family protein [Acidiferrobacterales bacterium]|nr:TerC family protein [Acidiferrobacterales bacterium]